MNSSKRKDVSPWLRKVLDLSKVKQLTITWATQKGVGVKVPLPGSHQLQELIIMMLV